LTSSSHTEPTAKCRHQLIFTRKSDRKDRLAIIGSRFRDTSMALGNLADYIQTQSQTRMASIVRGAF